MQEVLIVTFTLLYTNEFFHLVDTKNLRWSNIHIKGSQVRISKFKCFSVPEDSFILGNSEDPDEMPHFVAFHLGLHCFPKYPF